MSPPRQWPQSHVCGQGPAMKVLLFVDSNCRRHRTDLCLKASALPHQGLHPGPESLTGCFQIRHPERTIRGQWQISNSRDRVRFTHLTTCQQLPGLPAGNVAPVWPPPRPAAPQGSDRWPTDWQGPVATAQGTLHRGGAGRIPATCRPSCNISVCVWDRET